MKRNLMEIWKLAFIQTIGFHCMLTVTVAWHLIWVFLFRIKAPSYSAVAYSNIFKVIFVQKTAA